MKFELRLKPYPCGHANTPDNTVRSGSHSEGCRACMCNRSRENAARRRVGIAVRNAEMIRREESGESRASLAAAFEMSVQNVSRILCENIKPKVFEFGFPSRVLKAAADVAGASVPQLISDWKRPRAVVEARYAAMSVLRGRGMSLSHIGRILGGRDHSTVRVGLERAAHLTASSPQFAEVLERVRAA